MMKIKTFLALILAISVVCPAMPAMAATQSFGPITINAIVDTGLTLSVVMRKNDFAGAIVTSMDFGTLKDIGTGTLRSTPTGSTGTGAVDTFISVNSHGLPYSVTQTGTVLTNGVASLPTGALTVVPVYASADNAGLAMPVGAALGTKGTWVVTDKLLYQSETGTAAPRIIQAFYSITDDPAAGATAGVPTSQAGGAYSALVTFTTTTA